MLFRSSNVCKALIVEDPQSSLLNSIILPASFYTKLFEDISSFSHYVGVISGGIISEILGPANLIVNGIVRLKANGLSMLPTVILKE